MTTFYIITFLAVCLAALVFRLEYLSYVTVRGLQDQIHDAEAYAKDATTLAQIVDGRIETFQTATIQRIVSLESKIGDVIKVGEELDELKEECEDRFSRTAVRLHQAADDLTGKKNASSVPIADPGIVSRELMRRLKEQSAPLQYGGDE